MLGRQHALELTEAPVGQAGVDSAGDPLPARSLEIARQADAILFEERKGHLRVAFSAA